MSSARTASRAVRLASERHRALQVLPGLLGVADPAEDAAEDAVGAARRPGLVESLGEAKGLLRGVDREHVVAGVHVERGRLLVEAHQLDAGRPVLEQVDAALVVVDRGAALALVPERGADLAVQVGDPGEVLLCPVVREAALPDGDGRVDTAHPQRHVALLLADAGDDRPGRATRRARGRPCSDRTPPRSSTAPRPRRRPPPAIRGPAPEARRALPARAPPRSRAPRRGRSARRSGRRRRRSARRRARGRTPPPRRACGSGPTWGASNRRRRGSGRA